MGLVAAVAEGAGEEAAGDLASRARRRVAGEMGERVVSCEGREELLLLLAVVVLLPALDLPR